MQVKFRLSDKTWEEFLTKTNDPSVVLRNLVNSYLAEGDSLDQIIGVEEASHLWGLSPGYIKNLCAANKVHCKKIGQTWILDRNQPNPSKN